MGKCLFITAALVATALLAGCSAGSNPAATTNPPAALGTRNLEASCLEVGTTALVVDNGQVWHAQRNVCITYTPA